MGYRCSMLCKSLCWKYKQHAGWVNLSVEWCSYIVLKRKSIAVTVFKCRQYSERPLNGPCCFQAKITILTPNTIFGAGPDSPPSIPIWKWSVRKFSIFRVCHGKNALDFEESTEWTPSSAPQHVFLGHLLIWDKSGCGKISFQEVPHPYMLLQYGELREKPFKSHLLTRLWPGWPQGCELAHLRRARLEQAHCPEKKILFILDCMHLGRQRHPLFLQSLFNLGSSPFLDLSSNFVPLSVHPCCVQWLWICSHRWSLQERLVPAQEPLS